jgi:hypothetical protein
MARVHCRQLPLPERSVIKVSSVALDGVPITDFRSTRSALCRDAG